MKLQVFFAKFWPTTTAQYFTPERYFKAFISTFTSLHNLNEIASVFCQILAYRIAVFMLYQRALGHFLNRPNYLLVFKCPKSANNFALKHEFSFRNNN